METGLIRYNLKDRGRKHVGQDRVFQIPPLIDYINGPACQESVKNHDMIGFYGHWPRLRYGLRPQEGGPSEKGTPEIVEPAFYTTFLKGYSDGTIEHKAKFLDTDAGKLASKLYTEKVGGFSSCIVDRTHTFYGFDYVLEPNYTTNRGYTLDSIEAALDDIQGGGLTIHEIEKQMLLEQLDGVRALVDSNKQTQLKANEVIKHLSQENNALMDLCLRRGLDVDAALDTMRNIHAYQNTSAKNRFLRAMTTFDNATLIMPKEHDIDEDRISYSNLEERLISRLGGRNV